MRNVGFPELVLLAVVALLVFGPERLPELARNAGRALAKFRSETSRSVDELKKAADLQDLDRELRALSADVRGVRQSVVKSLSAGGPASAAGPRAAESVPPTDPEAT